MPTADRRRQRGSGLFGLVGGLLVFFTMLLTAVQVAYALHARTLVTDATYRAATQVAAFRAADDRVAAASTAEAGLRRSLGSLGERAEVQWLAVDDADEVRLRVRVPAPGVLPAPARAAIGLGDIERTITVRPERLR